MKNIIGMLVLLAAVLGCSSLTKKETATNEAPEKTPTTSAPKEDPKPAASDELTLDKFNELKTGMKYEDAVKILGSKGDETSSSSSGSSKYASYKWEGQGGASIRASFKNDALTSKSQSNLKASDGKTANADLTMAKYNQLENGMTYEEAVKIIGSEGSQTSSSSIGSYKSTSYKWEGEKYARIYLIFKDDKITSKSQSNLK